MSLNNIIRSIDELNNYPAVILMYQSGASGEFLASAFAEAIPAFARGPYNTYANGTAISYGDFLGHALKSGYTTIDVDTVIANANFYLDRVAGARHIILAHPASSNFIKCHLPSLPVIEISTVTPKSNEFASLAAFKKIPKEWANPLGTVARRRTRASVSGHTAEKHLLVEWEDLFLTQREHIFKQVTGFLNESGDFIKFNDLVTDYLQRNQEILDAIQ
jgi:hypothetical protein